ncbi:AMP-binding protein [Sphingobium boeckii]|uniref:Acyl-CoA synthetase (AMP-forming)/AMP-acid ligase II n=1 Tax=Sphingobium boeckii TaxID=1082345 RepID=A0A7W9AJF6_9SPHN|nr:AMP-binding protein [Sphingobium boeckii]MBB5686804.1 acyl-CoA synthetase (AMP-forming)/AMP-acid ligase II [Sphingobium boeckii]
MTGTGDTRRTTAQGWNIRWNAARADQAYADGWWSDETCADALARWAVNDPERILVIDGAVSLTAATLHAQATRLAQAMLARCTPGSVISFMLPNWHEAAVIYMGATLAGMVVNPILPSLRDHDLRFMLADVGCRMIFVPPVFRGHDYAAMLGRVAIDLDQPPEIVVVRGEAGAHTPYPALLNEDGAAPLPRLEPDEVRMVMYTSGTTGRPKGVLHTHNSLNALIRQLGTHWLIAPGDRFLVPSPISHIGGSIYAFETPLLLGATAILMEKWDAGDALGIMADQHGTHMAGATPFLQQLLAAAQAADTRLPDLKLFICGGASVPPALIREASAYFDRTIVSRVYGSTEVPVTTVGVIDRADLDHASETDGRAGIATIKLAPDGEIRARGPQMLVGYIHSEDEATAFDEDGYYRTGDQGRWIDEDYVVVTGRIKDLIIRNGENISPKEIEDLLVAHPDIAEIAIVGIPDARTGERAVAVIVPRDGRAPDTAAIAAFLGGFGVAKFKYPEAVALWDALPKNDAGKVLKQAIRTSLTAG